QVIARRPPEATGPWLTESVLVPEGGVVLRARGRRVVPDGPDLMFYTNSIRLAAVPPPGLRFPPLVFLSELSYRQLAGLGILLLGAASAAAMWWRRSRQDDGPKQAAASKTRALPLDARAASDGPSPLILGPRRRHYLLALLLYTAFVIYGSWLPLHARSLSVEEAWERFVPILTATDGRPGRIDFCTNVLLFVPLSFLAMAALVSGRRAVATVLALPVVAAASVALSLMLEFGQLWVDRTPSRFDVYAQCTGAAIGLVLWLLAGQGLTGWLRSFATERRPSGRLVWALKTWYAVLFVAAVLPLDLTLHPDDLYSKYRRGRIVLAPFANFSASADVLLETLFDALVCVPVGALGAFLWRRDGASRRSMFTAAAIGIALVAAIEVAQLFVLSRFTETKDVLVGAVGVVLGALMARRLERRAGQPVQPAGVGQPARVSPALVWLAMAAAYLIVPCLFFWSPFNFTDDSAILRQQWNQFAGVPFYSLYRGTILNAHTQLMRQVLLFVPFGILLACAIRRLPAWRGLRIWIVLAASGMIGLVALAAELGQVFLPGRTPDAGSVLLMSGGGLVGLFLTLAIQRDRRVTTGQPSAVVPHCAGR
ncbi:MAG TPA: VanZ family protein, partial [Planctomycetaceae bacterium]|nr:VanZ family protein [Planctomycetaceae bacterium]